jgi:hypothetical protein
VGRAVLLWLYEYVDKIDGMSMNDDDGMRWVMFIFCPQVDKPQTEQMNHDNTILQRGSLRCLPLCHQLLSSSQITSLTLTLTKTHTHTHRHRSIHHHALPLHHHPPPAQEAKTQDRWLRLDAQQTWQTFLGL